MTNYTVLLLYHDYISAYSGETYLSHVTELSPEEAAVSAQKQCAKMLLGERVILEMIDDAKVLAIFHGHLTDLKAD